MNPGARSNDAPQGFNAPRMDPIPLNYRPNLQKTQCLCTGDVIQLKDEHHRAATLDLIQIETVDIYTDLTRDVLPNNRDRGHDHAVS